MHDLTPSELRAEYHWMVDNGLFNSARIGRFQFTDGAIEFDTAVLHRMIDEHVDKLEAEYVGEATLSAGDLFIGRLLLSQLMKELKLREALKELKAQEGHYIPWICPECQFNCLECECPPKCKCPA